MSTNPSIRDGTIYAAQQERQARDVKILQGVNRAHREAFHERFPGQLEHCMRLVSERLQTCLSKPDGTDLARTTTWPAQPDELLSLAQALHSLDQIRCSWQQNPPQGL